MDALKPKYRVFLFEDEFFSRSSLEAALKIRDYEVFAFSTPAMCPHAVEPRCPCPEDEACCDFILSDVHMPCYNGLDFIERQIERGCRCRRFAVMASTWTRNELSMADGLGCGVFKKPFSIYSLYEWLGKAEETIPVHRKLNNWFLEKPGEYM